MLCAIKPPRRDLQIHVTQDTEGARAARARGARGERGERGPAAFAVPAVAAQDHVKVVHPGAGRGSGEAGIQHPTYANVLAIQSDLRSEKLPTRQVMAPYSADYPKA